MAELLNRFRDEDGTEKFVYRNNKGVIEVTWIKNKQKRGIDVFCLPTHYYCTLGCKFCHLTAKGSKKKKMGAILCDELLDAFSNTLSFIDPKPLLLLSFMGVGEPFLNYKLPSDFFHAVKSKVIGDKSNKVSSVSLALSTMMPDTRPLEYFAKKVNEEDIPLKIHFSLHSPFSDKRKELIPSAIASVDEALRELVKYEKATKTNTKVLSEYPKYHPYASNTEIHYTIIDGVNDSEEELNELIRLGNKYRIRLKLLKFNPTKNLKRSPKSKYWFKRLSKEYGASVVEYSPPGPNIGSSCGQFTKHYYLGINGPLEYIKFLLWKQKYKVRRT